MSSTKYYAPYNMYAPDGSTFQLQYAKIASEKGSTSIAVTNGKVGVLMAYNPTHNKLALPSLNKITKIGEHGLFAFAGITNDGLEYIRYLNRKVLEENITKDREIHPVYVFDDLCYAVAYRALSGYRLMGAAGILVCEYNQRI
ncbi:20S proteasome subunit, partial [Enterocytozoon bieneusi H348]